MTIKELRIEFIDLLKEFDQLSIEDKVSDQGINLLSEIYRSGKDLRNLEKAIAKFSLPEGNYTRIL